MIKCFNSFFIRIIFPLSFELNNRFTLLTLQIYRHNFLIIINGEIKYKWTQNINFMTSNSTSETGACIKHTPDDSTYICPLIVDATLTNYGLFPKKQTNDYISLYVGV